ncbi:MAG: carboxypeptidase regulatory-like domain-containing protein [Planctomycetes bacterium]|nr:carboxypeptidase regulatory-like domain-containing protein [Planctomycetota bacterium]
MSKVLLSSLYICAVAGVLLFVSSRIPEQPTPEQLERAVWIEGRVELPAETPADERVEIVAHAHGLPDFNDFAAGLDAQHGFKVAFAHDARRGRLQLRGRYAFSGQEPRWRPGAKLDDLVIKPRLGAWVRGKIRVPDGVGSIAGEEIVFEGIPQSSGQSLSKRRARIAPDHSFELGGLDCDSIWSARLIVTALQPLFVENIPATPGRRTDLEWSLRRGATLRGRVVDEAGAPLAGVHLAFDCRSEPLAPLPADVAAGCATDRNGAFTVRGLYPGDVLVRAARDGYLTSRLEIEDLADGAVRENLSIVLRAGVVLRGRIVDPSGLPAEKALVRVTQKSPGAKPYEREVETDADGKFTCTGLTEARVQIHVTRKLAARSWKAARSDVDPAAEDLVLTLAERYSLRGRVHDDLGRTILRYTAGVRRSDDTDPHSVARTIDVKRSDGWFEIDDLEGGDWDVFTYGRGIIYQPARRVTVPYTGEPLVFVVRRPATVAGHVLNADRTPAGRAVVEVEWERPALLGGTVNTERANVRSAPDGKFEITEVYPGRVRVFAATEEGLKSVPISFEMTSGEKRTDVEVVLTP